MCISSVALSQSWRTCGTRSRSRSTRMARKAKWFTLSRNNGCEFLAQHPRSKRLYFTKDPTRMLTTTNKPFMTRTLWQLAGVHAGLVLHVHDRVPERARVVTDVE